jgi:hypothetical protein
MGIAAALQVVSGATALPELVPAYVAQWVQIGIGAFDAFLAVWLGRNAATPADFRVDSDMISR